MEEDEDETPRGEEEVLIPEDDQGKQTFPLLYIYLLIGQFIYHHNSLKNL